MSSNIWHRHAGLPRLRPAHLARGGGGFAAAALVIPFFAVGARLFPHLLVDDVARDFRSHRLSYPLDYWNAVSCWGAMAIAIGLCVSAHGPRRFRAAALATIPVASLSIFLTFWRFGAVAAATAFLAALAVSRPVDSGG